MNKLIPLLVIAASAVILGAVLIYFVESNQPDSQINSPLDAVWWTVATVTTVGYGDIVPVTDVGRILSIFYMFFGISVLAIFLSVLGTRFYRRRFQDEQEATHIQKQILEKIKNLETNQEKLHKELGELIDNLNNSKKI